MINLQQRVPERTETMAQQDNPADVLQPPLISACVPGMARN
jgi:hypothetical protein